MYAFILALMLGTNPCITNTKIGSLVKVTFDYSQRAKLVERGMDSATTTFYYKSIPVEKRSYNFVRKDKVSIFIFPKHKFDKVMTNLER